MRRSSPGKRFVASEHGAALVEFAIVLPLLLLLVFGMIDLGRALYMKNTLTAAAREGGRRASVLGPTGTKASVDSAIFRYADTSGVFGNVPVTAAMTTVTPLPPYPAATSYVTVKINNYPLTWITPLPKLVGFGDTLKMTGAAVFRWDLGT